MLGVMYFYKSIFYIFLLYLDVGFISIVIKVVMRYFGVIIVIVVME